MNQTPFQLVRERLEEHGLRCRGSGRSFQSQCPSHPDANPSLSVTDGTTRVLIRCHAGCESEDVLDALGLTWEDLRADEESARAADPVVSTYVYADEQGKPLFEVLRTAGKQFRQRVPDRSAPGGYRWSLGNTRRVLYRLPAVLAAAAAGATVYVCEGEKDVHALENAGAVATCNPGGAGKWRPEFSQALRGAQVVIVQDNDDPGRAHAAAVARSLDVAGVPVQIVAPRTGKDAHEHLNAGLTVADFALYTPDLAPDLHEFLAEPDPGYEWVVQDLLERGDRMIITGPEGHGKSLLTRQLAICAAAGLDPFTSAFRPPQSVLYVDCENSKRTSRRHFRGLAYIGEQMCQRRVPEGGLRLIHRPEGLNLAGEDGPWLENQVAAHKPDLLVVGPLYRLHVVDANEETAARAIVNALDRARLTVNCALLVEAHSPHAEAGRARPLRPAGSSLFLRWPEFGFGLRPWSAQHAQPARDHGQWERDHVVRVEQWRGPREERDSLPRFLQWVNPGVQWPGMPWSPPVQGQV